MPAASSTNGLLVLIDLDGTLISCGLTPRQALANALFQHTGKVVEFGYSQLAGLTDPLIIDGALERLAIPESQRNELTQKILETYLDILAERYPQATDRTLHGGVVELLEYLQDCGFRIGLISGNSKQGAAIKLKPFNLMQYFSFGVFGSDHAERDNLPLIALRKVQQKFNESYAPDRVVIIGDTVRDVQCARRNGMRSIVVIRREDQRKLILDENPDLIVDNFEDLQPIQNYLQRLLIQPLA
jgi:phosphoglycolate phosphatase